MFLDEDDIPAKKPKLEENLANRYTFSYKTDNNLKTNLMKVVDEPARPARADDKPAKMSIDRTRFPPAAKKSKPAATVRKAERRTLGGETLPTEGNRVQSPRETPVTAGPGNRIRNLAHLTAAEMTAVAESVEVCFVLTFEGNITGFKDNSSITRNMLSPR